MAVVTYKCPNCGGGLVYEPGPRQFACHYCNSHFAQEAIRQPGAVDQAAAQEAAQPSGQDRQGEDHARPQEEQGVLYACPSCGAQVVTDATTAATFCYYCHNPVVVQGRLSGEFAPNQMIPFAIDRDQAIKTFLDWAKGKKFIPRDFFSQKQIQKLTGVYFPYWMVDLEVDGTLDTTATQVRIWRVGDTEYTENKHFQVTRGGRFRFPQVTRNALSDKYNRRLVEGVLPFATDKLQDFQMAYLSGFQAEQRNIQRGDLEPEVREEVREYTRQLLRDTTSGYTSVGTGTLEAQVTGDDWRYALLPVWVLTYRGRDGKEYFYAMNGQTGKICGQLPLDGKRLAMLFGAVALPLFGLLLAGGWLL